MASDPDGKSSSTEVFINVINVNDNPPVLDLISTEVSHITSLKFNLFQKHIFKAIIPRNFDPANPVMIIKATDKDGLPPILKIDRTDLFSLIKECFSIY